MAGYVYIMASRQNGTLYTGVTSDLPRRIWENRDGVRSGFTARYGVKRLVWYQRHENIEEAIADEKRIKRWLRTWKIQLIDGLNPQWRDLYDDIV
jgi:putative endonuclease